MRLQPLHLILCRLENEWSTRGARFRRRGACVLGAVAVLLLGAGPEDSPQVRPELLKPATDHISVHGAVARARFGSGAQSYWLFEPDSPRPDRAPVLIFLHGWLFVNPGVYGAWIDHLVRRGTTVIYPRFQDNWTTRPVEFLPNMQSAVRDALRVLRTAPGHVRPDGQRFAIIGHSVGGDLAVHLSGTARPAGLPEPRTLILLMPGRLDSVNKPKPEAIPATTLLVVAVADRDRVVGDLVAREIFDGAVSIPPARKRYILYRTDLHGQPPLIANHMAPTAALPEFDTGEGLLHRVQMAQGEIDSLDRLGFWRMGDLALAAGFASSAFDAAAHHDILLGDLGLWTDGQPITPPIVSANPAELTRLAPSLNAQFLIPQLPPSSGSAHPGMALEPRSAEPILYEDRGQAATGRPPVGASP